MSESKDDLQNVWDFISELNDSDLISKLNGHDFKIVEQNLTEEQINKIKKKKIPSNEGWVAKLYWLVQIIKIIKGVGFNTSPLYKESPSIRSELNSIAGRTTKRHAKKKSKRHAKNKSKRHAKKKSKRHAKKKSKRH